MLGILGICSVTREDGLSVIFLEAAEELFASLRQVVLEPAGYSVTRHVLLEALSRDTVTYQLPFRYQQPRRAY